MIAGVPIYFNDFLMPGAIMPWADGYMVRSREDLLQMMDDDFLRKCGIATKGKDDGNKKDQQLFTEGG
jgi:hypothetical protein